MPTLVAERAPKLEVTAVSPSSGRKKLLAREELIDLFALLTGYEDVLNRRHSSAEVGEGLAEAMDSLAVQFKVFGVDIDWYSERPREDQPLFLAKFGPFETTGHCLKDLLAIARETGVLKAAPAAPAPAGPETKLVFIVDDDDAVLEVLAQTVASDGFSVSAFADGIEMMRELEDPAARLPDLILLDLMLPVQGGYEILRHLQLGRTKSIPVIVITGRNIDPDMSRIMRQEPNLRDLVKKPIRANALMAILHRLLKTAPPAAVLSGV
ncbi:MAG: response regulator receiver protein [Elusimicrobia bacterium]|nr:MAG: response regulator receiver protein [Elusimicrobiota bacterium]